MAEHTWQKAFFSSGVDEPAGGERRSVQSAEAGEGDDDGEEEGTEGPEDDGAEVHGDGICGGDGGGGKDEDVGYVGEEVGGDDEGHGGMDDAGEVAMGVEEFADDVGGLLRRDGQYII